MAIQVDSIFNTTLPSPATRSPAKHRPKLDAESGELDEEGLLFTDLFETMPTTNQAVSELFFKEMMLALHSSIQQSISATFTKQIAVIKDLGNRVNHVENKMEEFSSAHTRLVDAHNQLEEEIKSHAAKLADLEDRNKRNNLMLRSIPESVSNADLISYIQQLRKPSLNWPLNMTW